MNRETLVDIVRSEFGITKTLAKDIVDKVIDSICDAIVNENRVRLSNLGTFEVRTRKERRGRKPGTGEEIVIPAKRAVAFRPSKSLKEQLNE